MMLVCSDVLTGNRIVTEAVSQRVSTVTTFILDDETAQTPIGDFLTMFRDHYVEVRNVSGKLLATLILPATSEEEDRLYEKLERICEQEADLLRERLSRPPNEGLTTAELLARLQKLDTET